MTGLLWLAELAVAPAQSKVAEALPLLQRAAAASRRESGASHTAAGVAAYIPCARPPAQPPLQLLVELLHCSPRLQLPKPSLQSPAGPAATGWLLLPLHGVCWPLLLLLLLPDCPRLHTHGLLLLLLLLLQQGGPAVLGMMLQLTGV